jgi:hypothetical protein
VKASCNETPEKVNEVAVFGNETPKICNEAKSKTAGKRDFFTYLLIKSHSFFDICVRLPYSFSMPIDFIR